MDLDFIRLAKIELTPRKVRVIYSRILLANNILNNGNRKSIITSHMANEICALSCGKKRRYES